jgi:hypothetical protein
MTFVPAHKSRTETETSQAQFEYCSFKHKAESGLLNIVSGLPGFDSLRGLNHHSRIVLKKASGAT